MRRHVPLLIVLVFATTGFTQSKPSFAGSWAVPAPEALTSARDLMGLLTGLCGAKCVITQDAATLKVTQPHLAGDNVTTFQLDGVERKTVMPSTGAMPGVERTTLATLSADSLAIKVVELSKYFDGTENRVETDHTVSRTVRGIKIVTTRTERPDQKRVPATLTYVSAK